MKYCFTLDLKDKPELIAEYKKWHSPEHIWKEIPEGIKEVGIIEMEIFLWQNRLFMIAEMDDKYNWDEQMTRLSKLPKQHEWEVFMDTFQQRLTGDEVKWQRMEQIFKLSNCQ